MHTCAVRVTSKQWEGITLLLALQSCERYKFREQISGVLAFWRVKKLRHFRLLRS